MTDDQKPTSALSAMINGRSSHELNQTTQQGQNQHQAPPTTSHFFQPAPPVQSSAGNQALATNNGSFDQQEAIRRRNLTLSNGPQSPNLQNSSGSSNVLVPNTSSPAMTNAGGFLPPGYVMSSGSAGGATPPVFLPPKNGQASNSSTWQQPTSWSQNAMNSNNPMQFAGGQQQPVSLNQYRYGATDMPTNADVQPPRKRLMKLGDIERTSSFGPDGTPSPATSQASLPPPTASGQATASALASEAQTLDLDSSPVPVVRRREVQEDVESSPSASVLDDGQKHLNRLQRGSGLADSQSQSNAVLPSAQSPPLQQPQRASSSSAKQSVPNVSLNPETVKAFVNSFPGVTEAHLQHALKIANGDSNVAAAILARESARIINGGTPSAQLPPQQYAQMYRPQNGMSPAPGQMNSNGLTVVKSQSPMPANMQQQYQAYGGSPLQQQARIPQQQQQQPPQINQALLQQQMHFLHPQQRQQLLSMPPEQIYAWQIAQWNLANQHNRQNQGGSSQSQQSLQQQQRYGQNPMVQTRMVPANQFHQVPAPRYIPGQSYPQMQGHPHQQGYSQNAQQRQPAAVRKTQQSSLVHAHRATVPDKKRRRKDSDSESDGDYGGGSSDGDVYTDAQIAEKESETLELLNTCKVEDLPDYIAISADAAQVVVGLRPFESADDIRAKLKKTKGVSGKLFDNMVDVIRAYSEVDKVFIECSQYGDQLNRVMKIWNDRAVNTPVKTEEDLKPGSPPAETGTHLVELDDAKIEEAIAVDAGVREVFKDYIRKKPAGVPEAVVLKSYQMLGINWLKLLYSKGLSCILADEMGLGKTVQVIAFLAHLKEIKAPGPHLIIVPSSTLDNWLREFDKFGPDLITKSYYGSQMERADYRHALKHAEELDVVVTTYNMASGQPEDRKFLRKMEFKTCTYDEGHQLKNSESKKYRDLMEINVPWRLLLTGTPLQNNLTELISLLSFILPDVFRPAADSLRAIFKVPGDAQANLLSRKRIDSAKTVMTPFVLRRKKLQVLRELPKKYETIKFCEMTEEQEQLYRDILERSKSTLISDTSTSTPADTPKEPEPTPEPEAELPKRGKGRAKKAVAPKPVAKKSTILKPNDSSSNVLMDLRKAANHPMLFRRLYDSTKIRQMSKDCLKEMDFMDRDPQYIYEDMEVMTDYELHRFVQPFQHLQKYGLQNEEWMHSAKIALLKEMLPEMRANGDRVLLFSQFTQVLDLLEAVLTTLGIRYLKLTGQTNVGERQGLVDDFYDDPDITVFLLSTRAGGLGLNLCAANTVILHDQDFNPHNDKQAEDRAWRIGQTRDVQVIRLIVRGTIEEDIYALAQTKLTLDSEVSRSVNFDSATNSALPSGATTPNKIAAEGDESMIEKKIKSTLLNTLRTRLEDQSKLSSSQAASSGVDVKPMVIDEKPKLVEVASDPVVQ